MQKQLEEWDRTIALGQAYVKATKEVDDPFGDVQLVEKLVSIAGIARVRIPAAVEATNAMAPHDDIAKILCGVR